MTDTRSRRQRVLDAAEDLGGAFLYYDRKESEDLPMRAIEDAIIAGEVTVDEIVDVLRKQLELSVESRRRGDPP